MQRSTAYLALSQGLLGGVGEGHGVFPRWVKHHTCNSALFTFNEPILSSINHSAVLPLSESSKAQLTLNTVAPAFQAENITELVEKQPSKQALTL